MRDTKREELNDFIDAKLKEAKRLVVHSLRNIPASMRLKEEKGVEREKGVGS